MRKTKLDEQLDDLGYTRRISSTVPKSYCLYNKKTTDFVAVFSTDGGKIVFNGEKFNSAEDFLKAVEDYNKTLYFPADTYNPDYRKDFVDQMRLDGKLKECGLKMTGSHRSYDEYVLENNLGGKFAQVFGTDLILSDTSWIPMKEKSDPVDQVSCEKIKSTIAAVYAYHISVLVEALNSIGKLEYLDKLEIETFNKDTMSIDRKSGKEGIVSKLEEVLEKLKKPV